MPGSSAELKCITDDPAEVCVFIEWGILRIFLSLARFHIISPSGAEYCSQANYKGADPSCFPGWTSRFNFVVDILLQHVIRVLDIRFISGKGGPDSVYPQCQESRVLGLWHLDLQGDVLERGRLGRGHSVPLHLQRGQPHVQNLLWRGHSWGRYVKMKMKILIFSPSTIFYF